MKVDEFKEVFRPLGTKDNSYSIRPDVTVKYLLSS